MEAISISLTSSSTQTHCKKWTWSRPNSLVSFSKKWTWPRPNSQMSFTTCLDWVVFCRSTPGYQVPCLDWVVFCRSTPRYQVRFSKSVRSFFFVVVIHNTHRQRRKSPYKDLQTHFTLHTTTCILPCCHTRPWERKTHCLSHFDGPAGAGERKFHTVRGNALHVFVRKASVMNGRSSVPTGVCSWSPWRRTWISTFEQLNVSIHVYSWIRRMSVMHCTCARSSV